MKVDETYGYRKMIASAVLLGTGGGSIGGFLCTVSGSIKLSEGVDGSGNIIVDTVPVTAGVFLPMPFAIAPGTAVYATLTGGAQGTFAVI